MRANGSEARDHQELSRGPGQQHRTTAPNPYWKNRQTLSAAIDRSRRCDAKEERLARVAGDGTLSPVTATLASRIHSRSLRHKVYQMSSRTELDGCIPSPRMILSMRPTRQAPKQHRPAALCHCIRLIQQAQPRRHVVETARWWWQPRPQGSGSAAFAHANEYIQPPVKLGAFKTTRSAPALRQRQGTFGRTSHQRGMSRMKLACRRIAAA